METVYAYDADGNISSMETKAGENVLLSFAYEYDGNGNRTAKTGRQSGAVLGGITAGNNALDISYSYDIHGQLLEEYRNGTSTKYTYDKAGNRIKKTDAQGEIRYFYNAKNQLLREEAEDAEKQFTYDRQGGIIKETNPSGIRRFGYDSRHRQTKVETENGIVQENRYDSENLRFELLENGKRTRFIYHDGELLHEEGGKENRQIGYHLGAGIEAFTRVEETYYYQQDEQLSTAFITGRNGVVHNSYQYDAFGNELETAGQLPNRVRYTGQQYDDATGQYYLRARYYNPVFGRFMQEDTYQGDGLNLYAYCKNNPVTYYDPSGYDTQVIICGSTGNFAEGINDKEPDLYHYTNAKNAEAIQKSGMIIPDVRGRVFVTTDKISPQDANNALFIGTRNANSATHRVEITLKDPYDSSLSIEGATQQNELIYRGTIRNGRNATIIVKENDF